MGDYYTEVYLHGRRLSGGYCPGEWLSGGIVMSPMLDFTSGCIIHDGVYIWETSDLAYDIKPIHLANNNMRENSGTNGELQVLFSWRNLLKNYVHVLQDLHEKGN